MTKLLHLLLALYIVLGHRRVTNVTLLWDIYQEIRENQVKYYCRTIFEYSGTVPHSFFLLLQHGNYIFDVQH